VIYPDPDTRADWMDLACMYRWLYRCSLQERLATQAADVSEWFQIGGPARRQRDLTAGPHTPVWSPQGSRRLAPVTTEPTVAEPAGGIEAPQPMLGSPLAGRPSAVKQIIMRVSAQTGVEVSRIMGKRRRWADAQARHLAVRRLAAMPWCGSHPSPQQIAQWMNMERTSVLHALGRGA
jgi:hypothetical protein